MYFKNTKMYEKQQICDDNCVLNEYECEATYICHNIQMLLWSLIVYEPVSFYSWTESANLCYKCGFIFGLQ